MTGMLSVLPLLNVNKQCDQPKCSKTRLLLATSLARTRLPPPFGLLQGSMVAVPLGAGRWPFLRDLSSQDARKGGGLWFSRRKCASPLDTVLLWRGDLKGHDGGLESWVNSLHWILCWHNNAFHQGRTAARLVTSNSFSAAR